MDSEIPLAVMQITVFSPGFSRVSDIQGAPRILQTSSWQPVNLRPYGISGEKVGVSEPSTLKGLFKLNLLSATSGLFYVA